MERKNKHSFWFYLCAFLAIAFPIALLFRVTPNIGFYDDWYDNMYFVGYFGEYFKHHFAFPAVLNTNNFVGGIIPVVYGYTLYPVIGFFSSFLGANLAIRLSLLVLYLWQFSTIFTLFKNVTKDKVIAFSIAALVIWATYPLTNIYNRGTLPEVYSNGFLTVAIALWFIMLMENGLKKKLIYGSQFTFSMIMAVGSWPPIIAQVILVSIPIIIFSYFNFRNDSLNKRYNIVVIMSSFFIGLIVLFPNIYAILKYKDVFSVTKEGLAFYAGIDNFFIRFSPFPIDLRAIHYGLAIPDGTPYLDAQVNMPLLVVSIYTFIIALLNSKALLKHMNLIFSVILFFCLFIYFALMSVSPGFTAIIPGIFKNMHFHYRYISYINISLLLMLISSMFIIYTNKKTNYFNKKTIILMTACLAISFQSVIIKNVHGNSIISLCKYDSAKEVFGLNNLEKDKLLDFPGTAGHIYAYRDIVSYNNLSGGLEESVKTYLGFKVKNKKDFGDANDELTLVQEKSGIIFINMYPFTWNKLVIDGNEIKEKDLYVSANWNNTLGVFCNVEKGRHIIKYEFRPERIWELLKNLSLVVLFGLLFVTILFVVGVL